MPSLASLRKDMTIRAMAGNGISLRCTKTSEISSFVRNSNLEEKKQLKKELNLWHKDTNFVLRRVAKRQDVMYKDLLKISRTKKQIKTIKESKFPDPEAFQRWLNTRCNNVKKKKPPALSEDQHPQSSTCLELSNPAVHGSRAVERRDVTMQRCGRLHAEHSIMNHDNVFDVIDDALCQPVTTPDDRQALDIIDEISKANLEIYHTDVVESNDEGGALRQDERKKLKQGTSQREINVVDPADTTQKLDSNKNNLSKNELNSFLSDDTEQQLSGSKKELNETQADQVPDHLNPLAQSIQCLGDEDNDGDREEWLSKRLQTDNDLRNKIPAYPEKKRRRRQNRIKLDRINPTKELLSKSTIEVRPGKTYDVTVYKKKGSGEFEGEMTSMDTTIDVSKYFNLSSRRDRLKREKLLEDARNKEAMQRHRVVEFLEKLDREREAADGKRKFSKELDDARRSLQRRVEALKLGPPKYGSGNVSAIPNYVRNYERRSTKRSARRRNRAARSSWSLPSLVTLEMATANSHFNLSPAGNALGVHASDIFSHLVNINVDKYVLEAAKV